MTPDELESLVLAGDVDNLVDEVKNLTESERRKLSKPASELCRKMRKKVMEGVASMPVYIIGQVKTRKLRREMKKSQEEREQRGRQWHTAQLAVFAMCPLSEVRREGTGHSSEPLIEILIARKPKWAEKWIEERLDGPWIGISWEGLRELIKAAVCSKPTSDGYIRLMVSGLLGSLWGRKKEDEYMPLSDKLKAEPELLEEDIWRLFEVETNAFVHDWYANKTYTPKNYETWTTALCRLAAEDVIERGRLIDSCLSGLTAGITNRNTLSGYMKLYKCLKPSVEELAARQDEYIGLLSHSASHVVTFALKQLKAIDRARHLNDEAFVRACGHLTGGSIKGQAKLVLDLLKRIVSRSDALKLSILPAVAQGLQHESADIQELALGYLEQWCESDDVAVLQQLRDCADDVAATLRPRLDALTSKAGGGDAEQAKDGSVDLGASQQELLRRVKALEPRVRKLAGLDGAAITDGRIEDLGPLEFDIYDVAILDGLEPVEQIGSLDELIEEVSHALEQVDSAEQVERIMDGISRFCDRKPPDFERHTGPLRKRIVEDHGGGSRYGLLGGWGTPPGLNMLLTAWLSGKADLRVEPHYAEHPSPTQVLHIRLHEIAVRVLRKQPAEMVAMPTHRHGWIDPRVFVERLIRYQDSGMDVAREDFSQALLRLAPDCRAEALERARLLKDIVGDIARWAMGGDEFPRKIAKKNYDIWITAGRSRSPRETLDELKRFRKAKMCPDGVAPAKHEWFACVKKGFDKWKKEDYFYPALEISNGFGGKLRNVCVEIPCTMLHRAGKTKKWGYDFDYGYSAHSAWLVHSCGMVWPQNTDAYFFAGNNELMKRLDMNSSVDDPNFAYFEMLFERDRPLTEPALLMIWMGLAGRDADARAQAVDLLSDAIADGRVHAEPLGRVFARLCEGGWVKLNRIGESLAEVSRLSALHAHVVAGVLKRWLDGQNEIPRDGHHLLSLLLDLLTRLGCNLDEHETGVLAAIKGSSKTAKLAKALLGLNPNESTSEYRRALLQQLQARVERAQRWHKGIHAR